MIGPRAIVRRLRVAIARRRLRRWVVRERAAKHPYPMISDDEY